MLHTFSPKIILKKNQQTVNRQLCFMHVLKGFLCNGPIFMTQILVVVMVMQWYVHMANGYTGNLVGTFPPRLTAEDAHLSRAKIAYRCSKL